MSHNSFRLLPSWMAFIFTFVSAVPYQSMATQNEREPASAPSVVEASRQKFQEAMKSMSEDSTIMDLYQAVMPIMTKQAQSDFKIWAERYGKEKAPRLSFADETLTVTHEKKSFTIKLEVRDNEAYWMINKKELKISSLRSPEELKDKAEKILRAEIGKVSAIPLFLLGESAHAFSWMGALFGALIGFGLPMLFGASTSTSIGGAMVGGALGGWFLNSSSGGGHRSRSGVN